MSMGEPRGQDCSVKRCTSTGASTDTTWSATISISLLRRTTNLLPLSNGRESVWTMPNIGEGGSCDFTSKGIRSFRGNRHPPSFSFHQNQPENIPFLIPGPHNFNGK